MSEKTQQPQEKEGKKTSRSNLWIMGLYIIIMLGMLTKSYYPQSVENIKLSVNHGLVHEKIQAHETENGFAFNINAPEGKKRIVINLNQEKGDRFKQDPKTTEERNLESTFKTNANGEEININIQGRWDIYAVNLSSFAFDNSYVTLSLSKQGPFYEYASITVYLEKPQTSAERK